MTDEDDSQAIDTAAKVVRETLKRASRRKAAQPDTVMEREEMIEHARRLGLLAGEEELAQAQAMLADAHLLLWRLLGSVGMGLVEPSLDLRLRAAQLPTYLRELAQGAEAALASVYGAAGGREAFLQDLSQHAGRAAAIRAEACTCDECLSARAAGRTSRHHSTN